LLFCRRYPGVSVLTNHVIYVHEIIEQALRFAQGFSLDPSSFGLDEIDRVGPGGDFLRAPLTRKHYRQAYYSSPIFERWSLEKWAAEGRPAAIQVLREYTRQVLSELQARKITAN
jgi:trimethylamine--corrinoid protein Co-methyltransferase